MSFTYTIFENGKAIDKVWNDGSCNTDNGYVPDPFINKPIIINKEELVTSERRTIVVVADDYNNKNGFNETPYYTMSKAKDLFKFPPNHPIENTAYAMAEVYPDHYVLVSEFHEYFKQTKHAAFIELCANLGAKEICIEHVEINNQALDINGDITMPLGSLGLGINIKQNRETGKKVAFRFPEENMGIKEYDVSWVYTEPSWRSMINLREKNHLMELVAEFNCVDDMGINAQLNTKFIRYGINIGGNFTEMTKIRLSYKVVFW
jgi:hypothetical protein